MTIWMMGIMSIFLYCSLVMFPAALLSLTEVLDLLKNIHIT